MTGELPLIVSGCVMTGGWLVGAAAPTSAAGDDPDSKNDSPLSNMRHSSDSLRRTRLRVFECLQEGECRRRRERGERPIMGLLLRDAWIEDTRAEKSRCPGGELHRGARVIASLRSG